MVLRVVQDHPAHGYALAGMLEGSLGWTLGLSKATIYTVLQRLEKRGWLTSEECREGRYPEKHVYSLTPDGEAGYMELLDQTIRSSGLSIQPFAALLLHADELPAEDRIAILTSLKDDRLSMKDTLVAFPPHDGAAGIALNLLCNQLQLELDAVDELLEAAR